MKNYLVRAFYVFLSQAYLHCAAVLGALSLASLFSGVIEWQGVILALVSWWEATIRPVVDLIYGPLVQWFGGLFGLELNIPIWLKDYLGVGMVFILSRWRGITGGWSGGSRKALDSIKGKPLTYISLLLRTLLVWPVEIVVLARRMIFAGRLFPERSAEEIRQIRVAHFISLLPVVYAFGLVVINWFVFLFPENRFFKDFRN